MGYLFVSTVFITVLVASAVVIVFYHGLVRHRSKVLSKRHTVIAALRGKEKVTSGKEMEKIYLETRNLHEEYQEEVEEYNRYLKKFPHRITAWVLGIEAWGEGPNE